MKVLFLMISTLAIACVPVCRVNDSRCFDGCVEICNCRGQWDVVMECEAVWSADETNWVCCPLYTESRELDGHSCLPEVECQEESR